MRRFLIIIKVYFKVFVLLVAALSMTGCWDNKDINHRSLPVVMGISRENENYRVFLQIPEPVNNQIQFKVVEAEGKTITHAVDRMGQNLESQIDLLHLKAVLIDKKLAAKGMEDVFSYFMRVRDISPKALVVLSEEELSIFFAKIQSKGIKSYNFTDFFEKNAGWSPQIALTRIWQVYRSVHSYTQDVVLPIVRSGYTTNIEHIGSAIIKNGKMVGQIGTDETLLFNMFNGESGQGKIEVMKHASVLINGTSLRLQNRVINSVPRTRAQMKLKVSVIEIRGNAEIAIIEKELKDFIEHRFNELLNKAQESKADILSLGQMYRRVIPRSKLKNWREDIYPRLRVNFDVQVIIQNEGFLKAK